MGSGNCRLREGSGAAPAGTPPPLADAHCNRGSLYLKEKRYDLAVSDFEKSIEIGSDADGCDCEPYNPLLWVYLDQMREYEKAREVLRRAQNAQKWIAPEYLDKLR